MKNFVFALLTIFAVSSIGHQAQAKPLDIPYSKKYSAGQIFIDLNKRRLVYVYKKGRAYAYPVATPRLKEDIHLGRTRITAKRPNPTWIPTENTRKKYKNLPAVVKPGDPKNAMGAYALNIGFPYIRIHGTNNPSSIGNAASGGCYRMYNSDVKHLAKMVKVGTRVTVKQSFAQHAKLASGKRKRSKSKKKKKYKYKKKKKYSKKKKKK